MNDRLPLPFAVPDELITKMRKRGIGPDFYGQVTFILQHGRVVRMETQATDLAIEGRITSG